MSEIENNDPVMAAWEERQRKRFGAEAMPEPSEEDIAYAAHALSEWLDDAAPLNERRYRGPATAVLKYAAFSMKENLK
jgi:hypothetical protein